MRSLCTLAVYLIYIELSVIHCASELMTNISQEVYKICPLNNFYGRPRNETAVDVDSELVPCCATCSSSEDCGFRQPCCPDVERYEDVTTTCNYPMYIDTDSDLKRYAIFQNLKHMAWPALRMMQSCPTNYKDTVIKSKCLNNRLNLVDVDDTSFITPVIDRNTFTVYANIFCSRCNGLGETIDAYFFSSVIVCTAPHILQQFVESSPEMRRDFLRIGFCMFVFRPKNASMVAASFCFPIDISTCNTTGDWLTYDKYIYDACNAYTLSFKKKQENTVYKNAHCYLCNVAQAPLKIDALCSAKDLFFALKHSFFAILNIDSLDNTVGEPSVKHQRGCPSAKFFDPYQKECRDLTCPPLRAMKGDKCTPLYSSYTDFTLKIVVVWEQTGPIYNGTKLNSTVITERAKQNIHSTLIDKYADIFQHTCQFEIFVGYDNDVKMLVFTTLSWNSAGSEYLIPVPVMKFVNDHQGEGKYYTVVLDDAASDVTQASVTFKETLGANDMAYRNRFTAIAHNVSLLKTYSMKVKKKCRFGIPVSKTLSCDLVLLTDEDYIVLKRGFIRLIANNVLLSISEYAEKQNGNISVCIEDYVNGAVVSKTLNNVFEEVAVIASFVCSILSIISLIVTLMTFCLFENLRTIPGKVSMCLCTSLLVAQTFQQFAMDLTQFKNSCVVFGIIVHFVWLKTLFWMNICSFNLFRLFSDFNFRIPELIENNLLSAYLTYAWLSPAVFVILNIVVSLSTSEWLDLGYGGSVCYISSSTMLLFTFTLPVLVLVSVNLVFLILTIIGISKVSRPGENVLTNRNNSVIFIKLSTLTGACWVFGYLRLWTGNIVFEYLFIFTNASQGVFLMMSFICNTRIFDLYYKRILEMTLTDATHST